MGIVIYTDVFTFGLGCWQRTIWPQYDGVDHTLCHRGSGVLGGSSAGSVFSYHGDHHGMFCSQCDNAMRREGKRVTAHTVSRW